MTVRRQKAYERKAFLSYDPPDGVGEMEEPYVKPWTGRDLDFSEAPIARFCAMSNEDRAGLLRKTYPDGRRKRVECQWAAANAKLAVVALRKKREARRAKLAAE